MNRGALKLFALLLGAQLFVLLLTMAIGAAVAPRMLLLPADVVRGSIWMIPVITGAIVALVFLGTLVAVRKIGLFRKRSSIQATALLELHSVPMRLAVWTSISALIVSGILLLPQFRPRTNDLYTQFSLLTLLTTMMSAGALPAYVMMRGIISRTIETVPVRFVAEMAKSPGATEWNGLRSRFIVAVTTPVAFVALGSSLLVHSHARAVETFARELTARNIAEAVFAPLASEEGARAAVVKEARAQGYRVEFLPRESTPKILTEHRDDGETWIYVPTPSKTVQVRFEAHKISPYIGFYLALSALSALLAALHGVVLGGAFRSDVVLAARELERTGAREIIMGTKVRGVARFAPVDALMSAIDALGGVFREFASAQERAIAARATTERMRALFLASMSHDLKAPLNAVLGFTELVRRSPLSEAQKESLDIIEQRGRELLVLIRTILDSARVEVGDLDVQAEWTKVGDLVMSAVLEARDLAVGSNVEIVGEIQPGVPELFVDSSRVVQALTLVIMSAVRFSKEHSIVSVRATHAGSANRLRIDVELTGDGLPQEERKKMFAAFRNPDRARRQGSLGLGLSLAKSILEIHDGEIEVDKSAGGGSVFHLSLPVENDADSMAARAAMIIASDQTWDRTWDTKH